MLVYLPLVVLLALCVPAAVSEGRARVGLAIAVAASLALVLGQARGPAIWALFALDLAAVLLLGQVSWKAPRLWPLWMMAALSVGAAASLAYMLQPDVAEETYGRAMLLTRYGAVLALLLGARGKQASHS